MRLSSAVGLGGIGLCCVGALVALGAGCSSSGSSGSGGGSGGDTCQSAGVQCTVQPAAPSSSMPTSAKHNYAMYTLYLGDTDRTGVTNSTAWESYGYNLDNLVTTKSSTDVCTLAAGAAKSTQVDGKGGIDNSFGENILPIVITTAGSDASTKINQSIQGGSFTIMEYVVGFDNTAGSMASSTGLTGVLLAGGDYTTEHEGGAPTWDMNTHWPIRPELLMGCTNGVCPAGTDPIAASKIQFPMAYQAGGTFVSGSPATIDISLSIGGQSLDVNVHSAIVTFQPGTSAGTITNGTIAGTIVTTELISSLQSVAGHISTSLCSGSAFNSISQQITQASDIIIDSSSGNVSNSAGTACNGISIGLGFDAKEIALPVSADIAGPTAAAPNPCDAGSD